MYFLFAGAIGFAVKLAIINRCTSRDYATSILFIVFRFPGTARVTYAVVAPGNRTNNYRRRRRTTVSREYAVGFHERNVFPLYVPGHSARAPVTTVRLCRFRYARLPRPGRERPTDYGRRVRSVRLLPTRGRVT